MLSRKRESSQLMTEDEFEEFWQNVDSNRPSKLLRQTFSRREEEEGEEEEEEVALRTNPHDSAGRTAKAARCGSCDACRAKDCGECSHAR